MKIAPLGVETTPVRVEIAPVGVKITPVGVTITPQGTKLLQAPKKVWLQENTQTAHYHLKGANRNFDSADMRKQSTYEIKNKQRQTNNKTTANAMKPTSTNANSINRSKKQ